MTEVVTEINLERTIFTYKDKKYKPIPSKGLREMSIGGKKYVFMLLEEVKE